MSGISSATSGTAQTVGTNTAPITFPGIASGIDYNSIVTKLTSLTLAPNTEYNSQITQLNAKNAELIKINNMFTSVQNMLTALSDPATFNSYVGTSTDPADASVTQIPGESPTPGTYSISSMQAATASQITGSASIGVQVNATIPLMCAGTAFTPTNGSNGQTGSITIDGVSVNYDVTSQSLTTIVSDIYTAVHATDAGFTISVGLGGAVTLASTDEPVSIGSANDNGNLAQVLKLDVAQVQNTTTSGTVTSAGPIGGVNVDTNLSAGAGFATTVTSGTFTINGVQIAVSTADDNVTSVLTAINNSTAGVVAAYDFNSGTFTLTNKSTGPQGIVVGASGDTSNFLTASGLTSQAGASRSVGDQAYVAVVAANGALHTTYSNSDAVAGAIPGMAVNVAGSTSIPFSISVAQDPSTAINTITNFVSAYNAVVNEIAIASAPPVVQQSNASGTSTTTSSTQVSAGGVLYGDQTIQDLSNELTNLVSSPVNDGSSAYNSLAIIGLSLDSTHTVYTSNTDANGNAIDTTQAAQSITSAQVDGTSGQLQALDVATFTAAFAKDPTSVANLFTSSAGLANQLGTYLTGITGSPTFLSSGTAGTIPSVSLIQGDENAVTAQITSLNQSVKEVTDKANAQADLLRAQFTASEALISKYQSEQTYANQISGTTSSSSS